MNITFYTIEHRIQKQASCLYKSVSPKHRKIWK